MIPTSISNYVTERTRITHDIISSFLKLLYYFPKIEIQTNVKNEIELLLRFCCSSAE